MTREEATELARAHLERHPFPEEGFRWVLDAGTLLPQGWYFEYRFERTHGSGDPPLYAGAKGFIIMQDGCARDVSWPDWQKISPTSG
jgi:hypothetical protein